MMILYPVLHSSLSSKRRKPIVVSSPQKELKWSQKLRENAKLKTCLCPFFFLCRLSNWEHFTKYIGTPWFKKETVMENNASENLNEK